MAFNRKQPVGPRKAVAPVKSTKASSPAKPAQPAKSVVKPRPTSKPATKARPVGASRPTPRPAMRQPQGPLGLGGSPGMQQGPQGRPNPVPFVHPQLGPGIFIPMPQMGGQQQGPSLGPPNQRPMSAPPLSAPGTARPLGGVPPMLNSQPRPGLPGGPPPQ